MTQAEKLIKIIINDLLKYLRLKERGLVTENRLKQKIPFEQKEDIPHEHHVDEFKNNS